MRKSKLSWYKQNRLIELFVAGLFEGEVEIDESYFGGRRKGRHGRGAAKKHLYLAY